MFALYFCILICLYCISISSVHLVCSLSDVVLRCVKTVSLLPFFYLWLLFTQIHTGASDCRCTVNGDVSILMIFHLWLSQMSSESFVKLVCNKRKAKAICLKIWIKASFFSIFGLLYISAIDKICDSLLLWLMGVEIHLCCQQGWSLGLANLLKVFCHNSTEET